MGDGLRSWEWKGDGFREWGVLTDELGAHDALHKVDEPLILLLAMSLNSVRFLSDSLMSSS